MIICIALIAFMNMGGAAFGIRKGVNMYCLCKTYKSDALVFLKDLRDESVDLVLTDPPYESGNKWRGVGTTARRGMGRAGTGSDDDSKRFLVVSNDYLLKVVNEIYRVLKIGHHAYVMADWETAVLICQHVEKTWPWRTVSGVKISPFKALVWDRIAMGLGYSYRSRHEFICFLRKGKKWNQLNDLGVPDVLQYKRVPPSSADVPTQKPFHLFRVLVAQSSSEGDLVVDPFMGSGTTARAAHALNRKWLGCDIEQAHVDIANKEFCNPEQKSLF